MGIFSHKLHCILAALLASGAFSGAVAADEALLEELKTADPQRAAQIVREVEREWGLSGSTSIDMLLRRGEEAMEAEDWSLAIEHFTAVTDHAPDFAEGYHSRATAYYRKGLFGPAMDDLGRALAINPNHWDAIYGLGVMMQEFERYALAEKAFRNVLELNPHHERAATALDQMARFGVGQTL